jgi:hypothetical protein
MIRAVLDANVLVSGFLSPGGTPGMVIAAWREQCFLLITSLAILTEIERVLSSPKIARRHGWSAPKLRAFLAELAYFSLQTPAELRLSVVKADPDDNRYLEAAVEGNAEYLVSGDQHLLALGEYGGIRILTARAFLEVLQTQGG